MLNLNKKFRMGLFPFCIALLILLSNGVLSAAEIALESNVPRPLDFYGDAGKRVWEQIVGRIHREPLNLVASIIFFLAIIHTFLAPRIMHYAHALRDAHREKDRKALTEEQRESQEVPSVSFKAETVHFVGEVEAIFGLWVLPLLGALIFMKGWPATKEYINHGVSFTEPLFVVVVMSIAASRPILIAAEKIIGAAARAFGGSSAAFWFSVLTIGPIMGSFITEPAAMTISALLLARRFYEFGPSRSFAYGTLGLLFVNVSIGGTMTHFAAPPVLMVATKWNWDTPFMLTHFGWKAFLAVIANSVLYFLWFRKAFRTLNPIAVEDTNEEIWAERKDPVPPWITTVHFLFLAWTVFTAHYPAFFIGGFLFFLAFGAATEHHQNPVVLRPALLVGFFLAGLVVHGGLQAWWIAPIISALKETPLFFGAVVLTAFNDNAAITYLASLVPTLSPDMKQAVVAGAVTGGGLTVIANAPNPAGQAILAKYFPDGISPGSLFLAALLPTAVAAIVFLLLG